MHVISDETYKVDKSYKFLYIDGIMNSTVSIDEFRTNLADLMGRVMYGKDRVVIKKYNRDAAILLSLEEYEKLIDPTKRFTKKEWNKKFKVLDKIRDRILKQDQKLLEREITETVKEVRAEKKKAHAKKA